MDIGASLSQSFNSYFATIDFRKSPKNLYLPIDYFLQIGGKRLRPYSLLLAYYSRDRKIDTALPAAAAIELFHNFTLIHDDVMDKAHIRRGFETVHEKYSLNTAILSGDALLLQAYHQMLMTPQEYWYEVIPIFNKMATDVCEGQQLDMDFEKSPFVSEEEYLHMIGLKTSVLIAAAMQIGAIIGGASISQSKYYYNFAYYLGVAFQIQDDILDCFGKEELIGKKNGGDILNNKKTILTTYTLSIDNTYKDVLFCSYPTEEDKITHIKQLYIISGAYTKAIALRNNLLQKGLDYLSMLHLTDEVRPLFEELVNQLIIREF